LSRIQIHVKETENLDNFDVDKFVKEVYDNTVEPDTNRDMDQFSIIAQPDNDPLKMPDDDDNNTIHTNAEQDPIVVIPISETAVNYGANQIIMHNILHSPSKFTTHIFHKSKLKKIHVQLSKNNFYQDVINFVKEAMVPNKTYYLYFEDSNMFEPFCEIIRQLFVGLPLNSYVT